MAAVLWCCLTKKREGAVADRLAEDEEQTVCELLLLRTVRAFVTEPSTQAADIAHQPRQLSVDEEVKRGCQQ